MGRAFGFPRSVTLLLGSSALISAGAATAQTAPTPSIQNAPAPAIQEVIVTASKRTERLQDTPQAVSVVNAQELKQLDVKSFQDYASLIPNLNQALGAGEGSGNIVLRGLYTGSLQATSTTSVYLGEAPFTPNGEFGLGGFTTPDPDLVDVDRIEVLKGPQGTLYGASSLGGLIRIIPKEPDPHLTQPTGSFEVSGTTAEGGQSGYGVRGSVYDALIPDKLAVGVSAFYRDDPGFITNVITGKHNYGQLDASGATLSAVATPIDHLKIHARILTEVSKTIGETYQDDVEGTGTPVYGEREEADPVGEKVKVSDQLYTIGADYDTALGTLTGNYSHTSNRLFQINSAPAYDALLPIYYQAFGAGTAPSNVGAAQYSNPKTSADNEEIRFASRRFGQFEFLMGAFHTEQDSVYHAYGRNFDQAGNPLPAPFFDSIDLSLPDTYEETSEFGNLTFYITDDLDITVGGRHTEESQSGVTTEGGLLELGQPASFSFNTKNSKNLYQVNLRWRPLKTLSFYAHSASGFRPGGPNLAPAASTRVYQPDTVYDYETGVKGSLLDRRLTFDASVYYIDWENVQLNALVGGFAVVGNGGAAHVKGVEFQTAYNIGQGFSVGGSAGYNDATLESVNAATMAELGAKPGDRLPGSPRVTAAAYGDYNFPVTSAIDGDVGLTARYQGDLLSAYSNSVTNPNYRVPAYATLDLRGSLSWDRYTLKATLANVTDTNGVTGYQTTKLFAAQTTPSQAYLIRPRTFTISLSAKF